jgi:beta-1,4-glucosyltransferase
MSPNRHHVKPTAFNCPRSPPAEVPADRISLLGQDIVAAQRDALIDALVGRIRSRMLTRIAFFNSNLANELERMGGVRKHLEGFLVLNDGIATDIAALLARGRRFPSNLNGSDLTPEILRRVPPGTRVFLYGSEQHVVHKLGAKLVEEMDLVVCGMRDGFSHDPRSVMKEVLASNPDLVLVALGNPRQELWVRDYPGGEGGPTLMGVGALFDFLTNEKRRAPAIVRVCRIEWLFRLALEPRRLARRYSIDMVEFLWRVLTYNRNRSGRGAAEDRH